MLLASGNNELDGKWVAVQDGKGIFE